MRWLKRLLLGLLILFLFLCLVTAGLVVALNTTSGQRLAVSQINKFGHNYVHLNGLSGRFPSSLRVSGLELLDPQGIWLTADQIRLDWSPLALIRRHLSVQSLTAQTIDVLRLPSYPSNPTKNKNTSFSLPHVSVTLEKLEINALNLAPAVAGQAMTLHVTGHAALPNFHRANIALDATTSPDLGTYHLAGTLNPQTVSLDLFVNEPPHGLIGHFLDPKAPQKLTITATLKGPRDQAKLNGALALGPAALSFGGHLNLSETTPAADIQIVVPALAPFATLANLPFDGHTTLHLVAAKQLHKNVLTFSAQDVLTLTKAPKTLDKLLLGQTTLNIAGESLDKTVQLHRLQLSSPGFSLSGTGMLSKKQNNLTVHATLPQISALLPQLNGPLSLQTDLTGPLHNLRVEAQLNGQISAQGTASTPFTLHLSAQNFPTAPYGTLIGTGALAGAPLALDASFTYNTKTISQLHLNKVSWKSVTAQADLVLQAGAKLPTGTGQISIAHLSDLETLVGRKLDGDVNAQFAYAQNQALHLTLDSKNVSFGTQLSGLNGSIEATGPLNAIAVKLDAKLARLMGHAASTQLDGVLDVPAKTVDLNHLTGDWHGLTARLLQPAQIELQPDLIVRHLDLILARANLTLDGTLSPTLNAKASLKNLDLSVLRQISPQFKAAGIVAMNATITGTTKAPQGRITLKADDLRYITPTTATLPAASLNGSAILQGQKADINLALEAGPQARATLRGNAPLTMTGPMNLNLTSQIAAPLLNPFLSSAKIKATGEILATAHLTGTPRAPIGLITLDARNIHSATGTAAALPPANLKARAYIKNQTAQLEATLNAGPDVNLSATGNVPLELARAMNLALQGRLNLVLLNPILAANGNLVHGIITTALRLTGPARSPRIKGTLRLADGSLLNVGSGLNLTAINASISAADHLITLQSLSATAGKGQITGHGTIDLAGAVMPVDLALNADHATPIASDLLTETLNAALTLRGGLKTGAILGGNVDILKANINIPHSLPPSVANLPIHYVGEAPAPTKTASSTMRPIQLALNLRAKNQIFIRGDGLFAELGGHILIGGTTSHPLPTGGFSLIRGSFSLAGKTLQFTQGKIDFNGGGFIPSLDLEATTSTNNGGTATLVVGGTASKPKISLSSSPPLPSDEILAQLLFAQSSSSLSPFQAASLAAALAQISGVGGGFSPLDSARNALGLDQLSVDSTGKGGPSVQAGRYVAPGVYVGASQSTTGEGSRANIEINLYKGLKLQSSTGTDSTGQNSSSVGLSYQFNY